MLLSFILLCLVHFYDNSASYLIVLPYLECLHEISNKEILFPDKYRMLFSSGDAAGRKANSIFGMLQHENRLLWMSGNSRKGGMVI